MTRMSYYVLVTVQSFYMTCMSYYVLRENHIVLTTSDVCNVTMHRGNPQVRGARVKHNVERLAWGADGDGSVVLRLQSKIRFQIKRYQTVNVTLELARPPRQEG
ncbi:hypothetical protein ElyMa_002508000 [Elysia marginata]|uniref:Secreted protein n=1 Tax=Elysia marginata TaxID=1093978 RepID=A0AAV4GT33_9GAST|nr:hypothetical protein ElyMa_002508000 [Elysia marginata]